MDIIKKKRRDPKKHSASLLKRRQYLEFERNLKNTKRKKTHHLNSVATNSKKAPESQSKKRIFKIAIKIALVLFLLILFAGAYFGWKIFSVSRHVNPEDKKTTTIINNIKTAVSPISNSISKNYPELKGEESDRINILLLGSSGENNPGRNLTDTVMVMSINTKTKKIGLLSIPRDLYVQIPETKHGSKINAIYKYGLLNDLGANPIKNTVSKITGLPIHYYLAIDYDGFKSIINNIGGITVNVPRDIYDPKFPGPNYSYETFEIEKGVHHMDGDLALKYARERHDDPDGDFGRAKRQQQVIQATKNKVFSLNTFLNVFTLNKILNTLENNIKTNIKLNEIESFIHLSKEVDSHNITNVVLDAWEKDSLLRVSHIYYENSRAFILVPRIGDYSEIHELAKNIFNLEKLKRRKKEIKKESPNVAIVNSSDNSKLVYEVSTFMQEDLNFNKITTIKPKEKEHLQETKVYDFSQGDKPFSLDEIIKKIPATLSKNIPNDIIENTESENYDFILVLGEDIEDIYLYEKISKDDFEKSLKH